jgi:hypothetical protein
VRPPVASKACYVPNPTRSLGILVRSGMHWWSSSRGVHSSDDRENVVHAWG